jgi:hypothetical protein
MKLNIINFQEVEHHDLAGGPGPAGARAPGYLLYCPPESQ